MSNIDHRELAQLGLKHIQDAIVDLLTRHPEGMTESQISTVLGLGDDLRPEYQSLIAAGVLDLLVQSGRILLNTETGVYQDNPERY